MLVAYERFWPQGPRNARKLIVKVLEGMLWSLSVIQGRNQCDPVIKPKARTPDPTSSGGGEEEAAKCLNKQKMLDGIRITHINPGLGSAVNIHLCGGKRGG